jgi:hypothetical protein
VGSRTAGYSGAVVEAAACFEPGSWLVVSFGAGVKDGGVLKEGRWWWPCLGQSGRKDDERLVFGNFAKCWERVRGA